MTKVICINDWCLIPGVSEHAWSCLITWLSSPLRLAPLEFFRAINMLSTSTTPSPSASNCPKACGRNTESIVTPNIWTQSPAFLHTKGKFNKCSLTVYCSSWIWFNRVLCCFYRRIQWSIVSYFISVVTIATFHVIPHSVTKRRCATTDHSWKPGENKLAITKCLHS